LNSPQLATVLHVASHIAQTLTGAPFLDTSSFINASISAWNLGKQLALDRMIEDGAFALRFMSQDELANSNLSEDSRRVLDFWSAEQQKMGFTVDETATSAATRLSLTSYTSSWI